MTPHQVRARMVERGTSFRQWSLTNGYNPRSVTQAVTRWAGDSDLPRGRLTYQILQELSCFIGQAILPGLQVDTQEAARCTQTQDASATTA